MAIYVGENKALLLKSDRSIAKLFKGDNVIFGYDAIAEGEIVTIDNAHSVEHKLGVKVGSKNLFDADAVLPALTNENFPDWHWTKQEDGSFYLGNVGTLQGCIWFENTTGYNGQFSISLSSKVPDLDEEHRSLHIIIQYTDGTSEAFYTYGSKSFVKRTLVSNANKTVSHIRQSYGDISPTYIKDIMIAYGTDTTYTPYMTDFSRVKVTRLGKNLINIPNFENVIGDGKLEQLYEINNTIKCGGKHTFLSCTPVINEEITTSEYGNIIYANVTYVDGYIDNITLYSKKSDGSFVIGGVPSTAKHGDIVTLNIFKHHRFTGGSLSITNIQLELGNTATEYEPYIEPQTVTANADGTVEGITSLSPNMTLLSDTDGVVINCEYVRG